MTKVEDLDLGTLSIVTEQGMFGDLNIENPTAKKIKKSDKDKDVDDEE